MNHRTLTMTNLLNLTHTTVAYERRLHKAENSAMRRARYSVPQRVIRRFLSGKSFGWFVVAYAVVTVVITLLGIIASIYVPKLIPAWKADEINGFLKDATSYLITAQVGLLAVVSVAVGLVTLIAQRDDGSSTSTDVQLYYNGALAYEVVASSVALLLVLCVQIF
jgi:O-antigen/teichoic acid export membrane protein